LAAADFVRHNVHFLFDAWGQPNAYRWRRWTVHSALCWNGRMAAKLRLPPLPDEMLEPDYVEFTALLTKRFAEVGEPWLTRLRPNAFAERLCRMGFFRRRVAFSSEG